MYKICSFSVDAQCIHHPINISDLVNDVNLQGLKKSNPKQIGAIICLLI